jgi:protein-L-isoaspartate(D-aspartate) O-methyltransferase
MDAAAANDLMVDRLIGEGALWSPALIAAFRATPRHRFLDRVFQFHRKTNRWREVITREPGPRELEIVYSDRALITQVTTPGPGQPPLPTSSSSQPSLMAQMLEDLHLTAGQRVLEVGAGTGYNAALIAHIVGPRQVFSVDVDQNVLSEAWDHLRSFPERKVELCHGDGRLGWPPAAPFDRIIATAAADDLESAWFEQLSANGLMLIPWNLAPGLSFLVRGGMREGVFHGRLTRPAYFLPLRGLREIAGPELGPSALPDSKIQRPAPWADWFARRKPRFQLLLLIQALIFWCYLHQLEIYHITETGQLIYGIGTKDSVCWFSEQHWNGTNQTVLDLAGKMWRSFLDAGGPWPTEFRLQASPQAELSAASPQAFVRQGPRCRQLWELIPNRDRAWF